MENYVIMAEDQTYSEFLAEQERRHNQYCVESRIAFHHMVDVYFNGNHRLTPDQLLARRTEVNFKTFYLKNAMIEFFFNLM